MAKLKNPFRLPKRFPNIIRYINKLVIDSEVPPTALCRIVTRDSRIHMAETQSGKLYFLGDYFSRSYLGGCMAGRFNTMIYSFIGLITKLKPGLDAESSDFLEWLTKADHDYKKKIARDALEKEASTLGLTVVAATEGGGWKRVKV